MNNPDPTTGVADTCEGCLHLTTFKARPDERERYGFGEIGHGCKHPVDGGVYVLNLKPTCLRGPIRP